ncbi:substrate-binding domain-containing protein [Caldicoprobacter algeriensis]|uniref:substrate-binding domain-containing protein n=1 Tax=Caldicoprobacter algeriensis TaxID=699281 RepID=UPI00207AF227|nr:substrate-binding domain-containing protein [Caldicoprobacter algeriensis]MCM8900041.1 substrate-binding domain-containing protein [Caldicoprobacter algeriensis]
MKKTVTLFMYAIFIVAILAGCGAQGNNSDSAKNGNEFDISREIHVISREEGSGTRGAFVELFGIQQKDSSGNEIDYTTEEARIVNNTAVMMTSVAGDKYSIGYISLGSLNDTVKALKIDGVEPTVGNVKSREYKIARPFIIATKGEINKVVQDFIEFIMSSDGQRVVEENGYIPVLDNPTYSGDKPAGKIVVAGSSSVSPLMEKLKEAYLAINPNAQIEIQTSDSTTGINSVIDGICDIGMSSRELKESELNAGLNPITIAMDGLVVIVNKGNPADNLTSEQVRAIFTGEITRWSEVLE